MGKIKDNNSRSVYKRSFENLNLFPIYLRYNAYRTAERRTCTERDDTSAMAKGRRLCWWERASIFPKLGETGKLDTALPSGVTVLVNLILSTSRSGSPGAGAVNKRSICSAVKHILVLFSLLFIWLI